MGTRLLVVPIICVCLLVGCATFDINAYKTLAVAKTSYTQGMSSLGVLQVQGKLSDADIKKILPVANVYYKAYLVALSAYEVYHANPTLANQDQLITLLNDVAKKLGDLSAVLLPYNITVSQITIPTK